MVIIRVTTGKEYCYIEEQYSGDNPKARFDELFALMNGGPKVSELAFSQYLIELMNSDLTKPLNADFYESLSKTQVDIIQAIKRFKKRLPKEE